jgi:hypothetical protein
VRSVRVSALRPVAPPPENVVPWNARALGIVVAQGLQRRFALFPVRQRRDSHHDVQHWLGAKPGHRRRPVVLNALCKTPQRPSQPCFFLREGSRPQRVISDQQVEVGLEAEVYFFAHALCLR